MTSRKYRSVQNITLLFIVTIFVAQKCIVQLLPIYLKYLNFSATEAGIIRACQTWISMFLLPVFMLIPKCLQSAVWKRLATSILLLISVALYLCLTFIPMSNMLQDVTHCQKFILPSSEELVKMYRSTQWDHHKSIQISSNTVNTSVVTPPMKMSYANNMIAGNASSVTWSSTSTVIPIIFKLGSSPISFTKKKTQLKGSSNFSSDNSEMLRLFNVVASNNATEEHVTGEKQSFPSETEQKLSTLMTNDAKTIAALKPNLLPVVNEKVAVGDKKNIDALIPKRMKFMHNQANYYSNKKMQYHPNSVGNSFHNKFDVVNEMGTEKLENANKLELDNKNDHLGNSMKTVISLLNKTVSKMNFVHNKFLLDKKEIVHKSDNNDWSADSMHVFNFLPHSEGIVRLPGKIYNPVLIPNPDSETSNVAEQNSKELPERKEKIATDASSDNGLQGNEAWLQHFNRNAHKKLERIDDSLISDRNVVDVTKLEQQTSQEEHKHVGKYYPEQKVNITNSPGLTPEKIYLNSGEEREKGSKSTNQVEGQIRNILSRPHNEKMLHNHVFAEKGSEQDADRRQNTKIDETSDENSNYVSSKLMLEKTNRRLQENVSGSGKPLREPHNLRSVSSKLQLRKHILHKPYINHLSHKIKKNIHQFYKRNSVHARLKKALIHDKNENFIKTRQRTTRRLMYVDLTETKKSVDNSSEFQVDEVGLRKFWSDHQLWNYISRSKLVTSWNTSFSTILIIAVFAEIFSKGAFVTSLQFIQSSNIAEISVQEHENERNDYRYKVPTLLCWGLFGCPLLTILVLATECSYQARVFLLFSTGFYLMSLLVSLFLLPLPETNSKWKLDNYIHKEKLETTPFFKRFGHSISTIVTGFAMACNAEYILWHIETLHGFTHNYQILYSSYIGLGVLTEALAIMWLKQRHHILVHVQNSTVSEPTDAYNAAVDGLSSVGPVLLGLHFLAASLLLPAWALVFLGILQGCCTVLMPNMISSWWKLGYGFGCLIGGVMVEAHGADWLFWIMAGTMFVWSAMVTLFGGLLKCIGNNNRDQTAYSQLLLPEDESDSEEVEICENEDWLEKAMQKDEQQEAQRRRIKSCPT